MKTLTTMTTAAIAAMVLTACGERMIEKEYQGPTYAELDFVTQELVRSVDMKEGDRGLWGSLRHKEFSMDADKTGVSNDALRHVVIGGTMEIRGVAVSIDHGSGSADLVEIVAQINPAVGYDIQGGASTLIHTTYDAGSERNGVTEEWRWYEGGGVTLWEGDEVVWTAFMSDPRGIRTACQAELTLWYNWE